MEAVRLADPFRPGTVASAATPTCCCCCCCCAIAGVTSFVLITTSPVDDESNSGPIAAGCFFAFLEFFAFVPLLVLLNNLFGDGMWFGYLGVVLLVALVAFIIRGLIYGERDQAS